MRRIIGILCLGTAFGCAVAPMKTYDFNPVARVDADFEAVWAAATEYFVVAEIPIEMIEKDSGLIVGAWMNAADETGQQEDKTMCDCGPMYANQVSRWTRGKVTALVQKVGEGSCDLRVTCTYEQHRTPGEGDRREVVKCNSTGSVEKAVQDYVLAKIRGAAPASVRAFKPAKAQ